MVAGIDVDLFRPDEELKKLAQLAVDLGVGDRITSNAADTLAAMDADDDGKKWLEPPGTRRTTRGSTSRRARASTTPTRSGRSTPTSR